METRSKKKEKIKEEEDRRNPNFRPWSDLPQDLLLLVIQNLSTSIPDLFAASGVSRSFRTAVFSAAPRAFDTPPLLLKPTFYRPNSRVRWRWPPQLRFQTLNPNIRYYKSPVSSETLIKWFLGCSNGNLIFNLGKIALIVDVFTNQKIRSPKFLVSPDELKMKMGILTAPPWSEGSTLLLVGLSCTLCWRLGSKEWRIEYLRYKREISAFAVFDRKIYFLDDNYRVKVSTLNLRMACTTLELGLPTPPNLCGNFGKYLVACDKDILLVVFDYLGDLKFRIDVYRLDFVGVKWEKVDDIGDWCLFVDVEGNCPMASSNPSRWGGRSNSIYLAGLCDDTWDVFPLDGSVIDMVARKSAWSMMYHPRWPSPMWVYLSKLPLRR